MPKKTKEQDQVVAIRDVQLYMHVLESDQWTQQRANQSVKVLKK